MTISHSRVKVKESCTNIATTNRANANCRPGKGDEGGVVTCESVALAIFTTCSMPDSFMTLIGARARKDCDKD